MTTLGKLGRSLKGLAKKVLGPFLKSSHLNFSGPFATWEEAEANSSGYDSLVIIRKVEDAMRKVLEGEGSYERDGTVFRKAPKQDTVRDVLAHLVQKGSAIVDFGGGLGGTYLANLNSLKSRNATYTVIEQPVFVEAGIRIASEYGLDVNFASGVEQLKIKRADILILSSVVHYLGDWKDQIRTLLTLKPEFVVIDRTPLSASPSEIFVQENDGYYSQKVSYPCWALNRQELFSQFDDYEIVQEWNSDFDPEGYFGALLRRI